jgi:hypothetical protein
MEKLIELIKKAKEDFGIDMVLTVEKGLDWFILVHHHFKYFLKDSYDDCEIVMVRVIGAKSEKEAFSRAYNQLKEWISEHQEALSQLKTWYL